MRALILVDLQYDFCPGGACAVDRGDETIPIANRILPHFPIVAATQLWHPREHQSFAANHLGKQPYQSIDVHGEPHVLWPVHCVQGSRGAELHATLDQSRISEVFRTGTDPAIDCHSGFFDHGKRNDTGLADWLTSRWIKQVYIMGLATDRCVKHTALDARALGFDVWVIEDGCRAHNRKSGDGDRALADLRACGCALVDSGSIGP